MRPKELVIAWVDAFNARDVSALVQFYAEDAINHQVAEEPVSGRASVLMEQQGLSPN
jgi:ketosteroid isomerase-like protein